MEELSSAVDAPSDRGMPVIYKMTALWSPFEFWLFCVWGVHFWKPEDPRPEIYYVNVDSREKHVGVVVPVIWTMRVYGLVTSRVSVRSYMYVHPSNRRAPARAMVLLLLAQIGSILTTIF